MEEAAQYEHCTKEELIQIIVDLKKESEALKQPVGKDSTNSSIPSSKELIPRTRSQRKKSGKKAGGQQGHVGHYRERNPHPDKIVKVEATHCEDCGAWLCEVEGTIGQIVEASRYTCHQALDYRVSASHQGVCLRRLQLSAIAHRGTCRIGPQMGALITYFFQCGIQPCL